MLSESLDLLIEAVIVGGIVFIVALSIAAIADRFKKQ
jgi:hypothetical protein